MANGPIPGAKRWADKKRVSVYWLPWFPKSLETIPDISELSNPNMVSTFCLHELQNHGHCMADREVSNRTHRCSTCDHVGQMEKGQMCVRVRGWGQVSKLLTHGKSCCSVNKRSPNANCERFTYAIQFLFK